MKTLRDLKVGETAKVVKLHGEGAVKRRIMDMGLTKGVEVAMFIYEHESQVFKVSLRSNGAVDVSKIAAYFGGGGHVKAAGCDLAGSMYDVINNISEQIEKQLLGQEE